MHESILEDRAFMTEVVYTRRYIVYIVYIIHVHYVYKYIVYIVYIIHVHYVYKYIVYIMYTNDLHVKTDCCWCLDSRLGILAS